MKDQFVGNRLTLFRAIATAIGAASVLANGGCSKPASTAAAPPAAAAPSNAAQGLIPTVDAASTPADGYRMIGNWTLLASGKVDYKSYGTYSVLWFQDQSASDRSRFLHCFSRVVSRVEGVSCAPVLSLAQSNDWRFLASTTIAAGDPTPGNVSLIWLLKNADLVACRSVVDGPIVCSPARSLTVAGGNMPGPWTYLTAGVTKVTPPSEVAVVWFRNGDQIMSCRSTPNDTAPVCLPKFPVP